MFGLTAAFFDEQIFSFLLGNSTLMEALEEKVEKIGEEVIRGILPEPLADPAGFIAKGLQNILIGSKPTDRRGAAQWHKAQGQVGGWAASRQEWLAEKWRHDWRSQPRDAEGRWIPGRLDYNAAPLWTMSARQLRVRRVRRAYRKAGRQSIKGYYSSWGRGNGR